MGTETKTSFPATVSTPQYYQRQNQERDGHSVTTVHKRTSNWTKEWTTNRKGREISKLTDVHYDMSCSTTDVWHLQNLMGWKMLLPRAWILSRQATTKMCMDV